MKRTIISLALLSMFIGIYSQADDTISTNIYQKNGALGIGTTTPEWKLQLNDINARILMGSHPEYDGPYLNLYGSETGAAPMMAFGVANKDYIKWGKTILKANWGHIYGNDLTDGIALIPSGNSGFSNGLFIDKNANVGIGTDSPAEKLQINGGLLIGATTNTNPGTIRYTGSDFEGFKGSQWVSLTNAGVSLWQQTGNDTYYNQGRVGIGTGSPTTKLEISGDESGYGADGRTFLTLNNKSTSDYSNVAFRMFAGNDTNYTTLNHTSHTYYNPALRSFGCLDAMGAGLALRSKSKYGIIKFMTGVPESGSITDENTRMVIGFDGNVGIGTTNPEWKLQLNDINARIMMGSHPEYDGPYLNLYGSETGAAPMMAFGVANKDYSKWNKTILKENWGHIYGNDLTDGIALIPNGNSGFPNGLFINKNANVGIGTAMPEVKLHLQTDGAIDSDRTLMRLHNTSISGKAFTSIKLYTGDGTKFSAISDMGLTYNASPGYDLAGFLSLTNYARGVILHASSPEGTIKMYTGYDPSAGAGIERMRIDSAGNVGIGTDAPIEKLQIDGGLLIGTTTNANSGTIRYTGSDFQGYKGNGWVSLTDQGESLWQQTGNDAYYNQGNVGIGTSNPEWKFQLNDTNTRIMMGSHPEFNGPYINLYGSETGAAPMMAFGVANKDYIKWDKTILKENWGHIYGNDLTEGIALIPSGNSGFPNGLFIAKNANIGIGTSTPQAKLHVADGDIYISDIDKGIIMKSPDGNCWRGVLDNNGQLTFSQVDCPEVTLGTTASPKNLSLDSNVSIFPNPSDGEFIIEMKGTESAESLKYEVFSVSGALVTSNKVYGEYTKVDISEYPDGNYILRVSNKRNEIVKTQELIKK